MTYYLLSIKWTYRYDFPFTFWGPNGNGYTYFKETAGIYNSDEAAQYEDPYLKESGAFPVPVKIIDKLWTPCIYDRQYNDSIRHMVINNAYTRNFMRIDPYNMHDGERAASRASFDIQGPYEWINYPPEETKTIKTDTWDITIREPKDGCEYGSQGIANGKTYKEARKEAYKKVNDMYGDYDFLVTMKRFKIKRIYEKQLLHSLKIKTWEISQCSPPQ